MSDSNPLAAYGAVPAESSPTESNPLAAYGAVPADNQSSQPKPDDNPLAAYGAVPAEPSTSPDERTDHTVSEADLSAIAQKHGVDPQFLWDAVGWYGGLHTPDERPTDAGDYIKETGKLAAGEVGNILGGIPQWLYKKFGGNTEQQKLALDDLRDLIEERKPGWQSAGEFATSLLVPMSAAGKVAEAGSVASKVAHGAEAVGLGTGFGLAGSHEGDEVRSGLIGAGVGAGLGLAGVGVSKLAGRLFGGAERKLAEEAPRAAEELSTAEQEATRDTVGAAREEYAANRPAEDTLEHTVLNNSEAREAVRDGDIEAFQKATTPEERAHIASLADPEMEVSARNLKNYDEDTVRAFKQTRESVEDFDRELGVGARRGGYDDGMAQEGGAEVQQQFRNRRQAEYESRELAKSAPGAGWTGGLRKLKDFISDLRWVTNSIDRRLGMRITPIIDSLSGNFNRFTNDLRESHLRQKVMGKLQLRAEKEPMRDGSKFDLYSALETPDSELEARLTPAQKAAVASFRDGFEWARRLVATRGLPIQKVENYVPHMALDPLKYTLKMDEVGSKFGLPSKIDAVTQDVETNLQKVLDAAARAPETGSAQDKLAAEYVRGLQIANASAVQTPAQMAEAINSLSDLTRTASKLNTVARSSLQRGEDEIPSWLLERDPMKLFSRWSHNTFRHAHLRGDLSKLRAAAQAIRTVDPEGAKYLETHIQDLVGVREGSMAAIQGKKFSQWQLSLARSASRAPEGSVARAAYSFAATFPQVISAAAANIYPYALGARVDKIFENLSSPLLVGLPSTGLKMTMKHWAGATADAVRAWARSPAEFRSMLIEHGFAPADQPFEAHRFIRDGIERSSLRRGGRNLVEGASKFALLAYKETDLATRGITFFAARRLADEALTSPAMREHLLSILPSGYRAQVAESLAKGRAPHGELARWLNGYTQFNYNRASMSAYGRMMGGMFSTFSKWPTSIAGEMMYRVEAGSAGKMTPELMKLVVKYMGPFLTMRLIGGALLSSQTGDISDLNPLHNTWRDYLADKPRAQAVIGKDPASWAPLNSAASLIDPQKNFVTSAPLPRFGAGVLKSVMNGDAAQLGKSAGDAIINFTPGNWILRFVYQDLPKWEDESPERGNPYGQVMKDVGILDR